MSAHIQPRLLSILQREMDTLGLQLSSSCRGQLEGMVTRGVTRMRVNKLLDNPGQILQAERNLKEMVQYFCGHARQVSTYPTLSDDEFRRAKTACPTFFPFWSS